ncbi:hypothetical protein VUR80DRAFT_5828 [Thermomyces stellatus]
MERTWAAVRTGPGTQQSREISGENLSRLLESHISEVPLKYNCQMRVHVDVILTPSARLPSKPLNPHFSTVSPMSCQPSLSTPMIGRPRMAGDLGSLSFARGTRRAHVDVTGECRRDGRNFAISRSSRLGVCVVSCGKESRTWMKAVLVRRGWARGWAPR